MTCSTCLCFSRSCYSHPTACWFTAGEWSAIWGQHAPGRPAPSVDFTREMVAGVFFGSQMMFNFLPEETEDETFIFAWQLGGIRFAF